jgi:hypothetical protein
MWRPGQLLLRPLSMLSEGGEAIGCPNEVLSDGCVGSMARVINWGLLPISRSFTKKDTVEKRLLSLSAPAALRNSFCMMAGKRPPGGAFPSHHTKTMSEPRSGEGVPNGIKKYHDPVQMLRNGWGVCDLL